MSDWRKRGLITGDVVFFEYVTSKLEKTSPFVYLWDIDKTYLDTHFESIKGLIRTAFEKAFQKKNIPGTGALVRALTAGEDEVQVSRPFPIYFISASPPQMERKIRTKLEIDGINPYGAFFKDNLRNLKPKYFRKLTQHVGYKLQALMELRQRLNDNVRQVLFGDDSETDAVVYSLYSDLCARRIPSQEIEKILEQYHVEETQVQTILELMERSPVNDPVEKVYINLANDTDPDYYEKFGRRMLPTFNTFQIAVDLFQDRKITEAQVLRVTQDMVTNYGFTTDEISSAIDDFLNRKLITIDTMAKVMEILTQNKLVPSYYRPTKKPMESLEEVKGQAPWIPVAIDYFNDFR